MLMLSPVVKAPAEVCLDAIAEEHACLLRARYTPDRNVAGTSPSSLPSAVYAFTCFSGTPAISAQWAQQK
jgi:hypothetical protein